MNEITIVVSSRDQSAAGFRQVRTTARRAGREAGEAFAEAFTGEVDDLGPDVADTIADGLTGHMDQIGEEAGDEFRVAFRREAERAGEQAGDAIRDGVVDAAEDAGRQAGDELEQGVDDSGAAEDVGGGFFAVAGPMMAAAALAAGLAAGEALMRGVTEAMDREGSQAKLSAQLGDPRVAGELGRVAGKLYGDAYGESLADAYDAVRRVWQSGLVDEDATAAEIETLTGQAMALAEAFDIDVSEAARAAGQMVRNGLAKDGQEAMDILTRMFQQTGDMSDDLIDTIVEYSTQFRELGISGPKAMGMLVQAVRAGARDTDTAADALKEFAIRSKNGSQASADAFRSLGFDANKMFQIFARGGPEADRAMKDVLDRLKAMKDPVEQDATAVALFGTKAEDLGDALYAMDPTTAVRTLGEVGGAAEDMADTLNDTTSHKLEKFKRFLESGLVGAGEGILGFFEGIGDDPAFQEMWEDLVEPIRDDVLPVLKDLVEFFRDEILPILEKSRAEGFEKIEAALERLDEKISGNKEELNTLLEAFKTVVELLAENVFPILEVLGSVALASVIDSIGRTIDAIGWIIDTLQDFNEAVENTGEWTKEKWEDILGFFRKLPGRIRSATAGMWDGIKDAFRDSLNWIIRRWNSLSFTVPSVGGIGGQTISTPNIRPFATGGLTGGLIEVGEHGREILQVPYGSRVHPHGAAEAMLAGAGGRLDLVVSTRQSGGRDLMEVLLELLRFEIRTRHGGNVQVALGA